MIDFLGGQTDYAYFAHGLAFVLMASTARALAWQTGHPFAWKWLAAFAAGVGLSHWLAVILVALGPSPILYPLRAAAAAAGYLALARFCRESGPAPRHSDALAVVLLAVVVTSGLLGGWTGLENAFRFVVVLPSAAWASWLFLRRSRHHAEDAALAVPGCGFALIGVVAGVVVPFGGLTPLPVGHPALVSRAGLLVQTGCLLAAVLLAFGIWRYYSGRQHAEERHSPMNGWTRYERGLTAALALVLLGGWGVTEWTAGSERAESDELVGARAATAAAVLPAGMIERLIEGQDDEAAGAYAGLRALLGSVCTARRDVVSASLLTLRGGQVVYLVEATPDAGDRAGDPTAAPGDPFRGPLDVVSGLMTSGGAAGTGHAVRQERSGVSSFAPIRLSSGKVGAVLDLKIDPSDRRQSVARARLTPILLTLATGLLLVAFFVSERKMAESTTRMAASERRYRGLVDGSPNGIMLLDADGRCLTINQTGLHDLRAAAGGRRRAAARGPVARRRASCAWPR